MRVKSDPLIPSNTQAIERQGAKARQDKWMLEIERAILASKPPQAMTPGVDNGRGDSIGASVDSEAQAADDAPSPSPSPAHSQPADAGTAAPGPSLRALAGQVAARTENHDDPDPAPGMQAAYAIQDRSGVIATDSARIDQGTGTGALETEGTGQPGRAGPPAMLVMHGATAMRIDTPPAAMQAPASLAGPSSVQVPAQAGSAAAPAASGTAVVQRAGNPPTASASTSGPGTAAGLPQAGAAAPPRSSALQPGEVGAPAGPAQPPSFLAPGVDDAHNTTSAATAMAVSSTVGASGISVAAAVASYGALAVGAGNAAPAAAVLVPQAGAQDEPVQDDAALARRGVPKRIDADAEPYGLRNLHLVETEAGMHAWVRDANLASQQGASVARALVAQFVEQGTPVGSVTVNGRVYTQEPSPEADEREQDDHVADLFESTSGLSDTNYIKGAA